MKRMRRKEWFEKRKATFYDLPFGRVPDSMAVNMAKGTALALERDPNKKCASQGYRGWDYPYVLLEFYTCPYMRVPAVRPLQETYAAHGDDALRLFAKHDEYEEDGKYIHNHQFFKGSKGNVYYVSIVSMNRTHNYHYDASEMTAKEAQAALEKKREEDLRQRREERALRKRWAREKKEEEAASKVRQETRRRILGEAPEALKKVRMPDRKFLTEELGFCGHGVNEMERVFGGADKLYGRPLGKLMERKAFALVKDEYECEVESFLVHMTLAQPGYGFPPKRTDADMEGVPA